MEWIENRVRWCPRVGGLVRWIVNGGGGWINGSVRGLRVGWLVGWNKVRGLVDGLCSRVRGLKVSRVGWVEGSRVWLDG